jgi:hypothetical protein
VQAGCNVNHINNEGKFTLHYAVRNPSVTLEIIKFFVSQSADVNKILYNNESVLESYCSYRQTLDPEITSFIIRLPFRLQLLSSYCFNQIKPLVVEAISVDVFLMLKVMHRLKCYKLLR